MRNPDLFSSVIWFITGALFFIGGLLLGFGQWHAPSAGFLPTVIGAVLALLAAILFFKSFGGGKISPDKNIFETAGRGQKKLLYSFFSLIFYLVGLASLGYLITTFLFILYLVKFIGGKRWGISVGIAVLTAVISYFIFGVELEIPLPKGWLKFGI